MLVPSPPHLQQFPLVVFFFHQLERHQNYAARLILQQRGAVSATWMCKQLGWPTTASRRRLSEAIVTFRCTSGPSPLSLSTLFKPAVSVHHHGTRSASSNSLYPPRVSTEFGKSPLLSVEFSYGTCCLTQPTANYEP